MPKNLHVDSDKHYPTENNAANFGTKAYAMYLSVVGGRKIVGSEIYKPITQEKALHRLRRKAPARQPDANIYGHLLMTV